MIFSSVDGSKSATTLAYLDTGKTSAALSRRLINSLCLKQSGSAPIHSNTETKDAATYRLTAAIPNAPKALVEMDCIELENPFEFDGAEAIIGMGFLQFGALVLQPPGLDSFFQLLRDDKPLIKLPSAWAAPGT